MGSRWAQHEPHSCERAALHFALCETSLATLHGTVGSKIFAPTKRSLMLQKILVRDDFEAATEIELG